jgi:hypothetical protein
VSATAAISADNLWLATSSAHLPAALLVGKRPLFAQASEADRNNSPGYSWPPHLYQEHKRV